jgi:hypothetical protein
VLFEPEAHTAKRSAGFIEEEGPGGSSCIAGQSWVPVKSEEGKTMQGRGQQRCGRLGWACVPVVSAVAIALVVGSVAAAVRDGAGREARGVESKRATLADLPLAAQAVVGGVEQAQLEGCGCGALLRGGEGEELGYRGLVVQDAQGRELRAWMEVRGEELLLRVDDAGARYRILFDPFVQQAKLTASGGAEPRTARESLEAEV